MALEIIDADAWLSPANRLKSNRERRHELLKWMRALEALESMSSQEQTCWIDLRREYLRLGKERLPLTRMALGVWPTGRM